MTYRSLVQDAPLERISTIVPVSPLLCALPAYVPPGPTVDQPSASPDVELSAQLAHDVGTLLRQADCSHVQLRSRCRISRVQTRRARVQAVCGLPECCSPHAVVQLHAARLQTGEARAVIILWTSNSVCAEGLPDRVLGCAARPRQGSTPLHSRTRHHRRHARSACMALFHCVHIRT
jgi:hypothetical protein